MLAPHVSAPAGFHVQRFVTERHAWVHVYWSADEADARTHAVMVQPLAGRVRVVHARSEEDQRVVWPPKEKPDPLCPERTD